MKLTITLYMIECYSFVNGIIQLSEDIQECALVSLIDPTDEEIIKVASSIDIDADDLFAVLDKDEISRFEEDDDRIGIYIDVPYLSESGNYETIPLYISIKGKHRVCVCKKRTEAVENILKTSTKSKFEEGKRTNFLIAIKGIIAEYQRDLRKIEDARKNIEERNRVKKVNEGDILKLYDLGNSLVYFTTSLNGLYAVIDSLKVRYKNDFTPYSLEMIDDIIIECKQAIEMAANYNCMMESTKALIVTKINLRTNQTMKKLTNITIALTIPMIITAAYGMNVSLPLQDSPTIFLGIFGGSLIGCFVIYRLLSKMDLL